MSDAWVVALVGGTAATVVGGLLIEPARRFLRRVWHRVIAVVRVGARVVWRGLAGSVPVWVVLGVVGLVQLSVVVGRRLAGSAPPG